jgi:hypothetical protein
LPWRGSLRSGARSAGASPPLGFQDRSSTALADCRSAWIGAVEVDVLERLGEIRRPIAGETDARGVDAVRAALSRLFSAFVVHPQENPRYEGQGRSKLVDVGHDLMIELVVHERALEAMTSGCSRSSAASRWQGTIKASALPPGSRTRPRGGPSPPPRPPPTPPFPGASSADARARRSRPARRRRTRRRTAPLPTAR